MSVCRRARSLALVSSSSLTVDGEPPERNIAFDHREPVVGDIVDDAMRDAVRRVFPRPHQLVGLLGAATAIQSSTLYRCRRRPSVAQQPPGAHERGRALGLHRVQPRQRIEPPDADRVGHRSAHAVASAPPPTCTKSRSRCTRPRCASQSCSAISSAIVRPPSMVSGASVPWQQKGTAPASTAARNGGSTDRRARPARAGTRRSCAPSTIEPCHHRPARHRTGMNTRKRPLDRSGHDRRREGGVAARRDRELLGQRSSWVMHVVQQQPEEVTSFVRAADVAGVVLDPQARPRRARRCAERRLARQGRDDESMTVDARRLRRRVAPPDATKSPSDQPCDSGPRDTSRASCGSERTGCPSITAGHVTRALVELGESHRPTPARTTGSTRQND